VAIYLGKRKQGDLIQFRSFTIPTRETHEHLYTAVIGPFKSKVGAGYFARYGRNDPNIRTADDVERLARADPLMEQAIVEESLTDEERTIARECEAQDQAEYSQQSILPLPVKPWQITLDTQGAKTCLLHLNTCA
jgi:hypothetical protein